MNEKILDILKGIRPEFEFEGVEDISSCLSQEARESVAAIITRMFLQYFIVFISLFDKSFWLRAQRN